MAKKSEQTQACSLVRDLLPSYVDGLTSETTNRYIEAHLAGCEACRAAHSGMANAGVEATFANETPTDAGEGKFLRKVKRGIWARIGAACVVLLVCAALLGYLGFVRVYPFPVDKMQVAERYTLSDGSVYVVVQIEDKLASLHTFSFYTEGTAYGDDTSAEETTFTYLLGYRFWDRAVLPAEPGAGHYHFVITPQADGTLPDAVYFTGVNGTKSMLLWQRGDAVPPIPPALEEEIADKVGAPFWTS